MVDFLIDSQVSGNTVLLLQNKGCSTNRSHRNIMRLKYFRSLKYYSHKGQQNLRGKTESEIFSLHNIWP